MKKVIIFLIFLCIPIIVFGQAGDKTKQDNITGFYTKYKDMGDGTYAEIVSLGDSVKTLTTRLDSIKNYLIAINSQLKNNVISDSGQIIGIATGTHTAGTVIGQASSANSCSLISLNNSSLVSANNGNGQVAEIILIGSTVGTNSVSGTIGIEFFQSTSSNTTFGDGSDYQPSIAIERGTVGFDSVNMSKTGFANANIFRGIKSCHISYNCGTGNKLYMRLYAISDILLDGMLWYRIVYK